MASENEFPTIKELRDQLSKLVSAGLGELPFQIVVAPDSTIQALAKHYSRQQTKPAIMVEYIVAGRPVGISFITTERLTPGNGMPSVLQQ